MDERMILTGLMETWYAFASLSKKFLWRHEEVLWNLNLEGDECHEKGDGKDAKAKTQAKVTRAEKSFETQSTKTAPPSGFQLSFLRLPLGCLPYRTEGKASDPNNTSHWAGKSFANEKISSSNFCWFFNSIRDDKVRPRWVKVTSGQQTHEWLWREIKKARARSFAND